jgi:hypothetical protein
MQVLFIRYVDIITKEAIINGHDEAAGAVASEPHSGPNLLNFHSRAHSTK